MTSKHIALIALFFFTKTSQAQSIEPRLFQYQFSLYDNPIQFQTIRQGVLNHQSLYRLVSKTSRQSLSSIGNLAFQSLALYSIAIPYSQAEAQKAILTFNQIGSDFQPWDFALPETSVNSVTDQDLSLLKIRDNRQYVRLLSAATESNYLWISRMEDLIFFGHEDFQNVKYEFFFRKMLSYGYHISSLLPQLSEDVRNNGNPLHQRIANISVFSFAKHIFNDSIKFQRNIAYADLSQQERSYLSRVGWLSFVNLVSNFIVGTRSFPFNKNTEMAFSLSQLLSPIGEVYNQDFWFRKKGGSNIKVTFREYVSWQSVFPGVGLKFFDWGLRPKFSADLSTECWVQPTKFIDKVGHFGGAGELTFKYVSAPRRKTNIKKISFDLSAMYKSNGFVPGILNLNEQLILSGGLTLAIE